MEKFKIENYERAHGIGTFIPYRHLSADDASRILKSLKRCLGLSDQVDPKGVVTAIRDRSRPVTDLSASSEGFDLDRVLTELGFKTAETVYLNWYRFDNIDELRTLELFKVFSDLWYPASDEIDILDTGMRWILSIEDNGNVRSLSLC